MLIGVTGSLATGKSTVTALLKELGAKVIDADAVVHRQLKDRRSLCYRAICARFGKDILTQGEIDRKKLAKIVFNDPQELKQLEGIIHPITKQVIWAKAEAFLKQKKSRVVVLDVPLLFESGWAKDVDAVIVVAAERSAQIARAVRKLHISPLEAEQRIKQQLPLPYKKRRADFVVDNNGNIKETKRQVQDLWKKIERKITKQGD